LIKQNKNNKIILSGWSKIFSLKAKNSSYERKTEMKNIIKRVSAFAMAFTLLGSGTAIAKNVNPKFDTAITASAIQRVDYFVYDRDFYHTMVWSRTDDKCYYFNAGPGEYFKLYWGVYRGKKQNTIMIKKFKNGKAVETSYFDIHYLQGTY
jgi:hypothetical protein